MAEADEYTRRTSTRTGAGARKGTSEARSAAQQLAAIRSGQLTRSEAYQVTEETAVYDMVDESEFQNLQKQRQDENFIDADGDDQGYVDTGIEIWDDMSGDEGERPQFRAKRLVGIDATHQRAEKQRAAAAKSKVADVFLRGKAGQTVGPGNNDTEMVDAGGDEGFQDLLAELTADPLGLNSGAGHYSSKKTTRDFEEEALFNRDVKSSRPNQGVRVTAPQPGRPAATSINANVFAARKDIEMAEAGDDGEWGGGMGEADHDADVVREPAAKRVPPKIEAAAESKVGAVPVAPVAPERTSNVKSRSAGSIRAATKVVSMSETTTDISAQNDWFNLQQDVKPMEETPTNAAPGTSAVNVAGPVPRNEEGQVMFFWLDMYEDQYNPAMRGSVYMFGKVLDPADKKYKSAAIQIKQVPRILYFLFRERALDETREFETDEPVTADHVYQEVSEMLRLNGIPSFRHVARRKKYCFEDHDVPAEADYLEVAYSGEYPVISEANHRGRTYSKVFGSNTSCIETLVLNLDLMGPTWLAVSNAGEPKMPFSYCNYEMVVGKYRDIAIYRKETLPNPPLVVMSLAMKTQLNAAKHANEVVVVSALIHRDVSMDSHTPNPEKNYETFTAVRKLDNAPFPFGFESQAGKNVFVHQSELSLLNFLAAKIQRIDPDVIVGHNVIGFDLDVILHRMQRDWSKLGRLRTSQRPRLQAGPGGQGDSTWAVRTTTAGRLLCDTYMQCKALVSMKNYSLATLASTLLKLERRPFENSELPNYYSSNDNMRLLINHTTNDAFLALGVMFNLNMIPLTKQITMLCGNLWIRSLIAGRAERIEYLLLHEFHRRDYIKPDKAGFKKDTPAPAAEDDDDDDDDTPVAKTSGKRRKKAAYKGGLVLTPKRGFYDKFIIVLDFNSLYPSIIQEHNICFTTCPRPKPVVDEEGNEQPVIAELPDKAAEMGVLPSLLKTLVEQRKIVKGLMKESANDPIKTTQYDVRQKAIKLTANSMYGCLGFEGSRFYAMPLAALVTTKGRETLQSAVSLAENKLNLDVIYGDTDSIMINSRIEDLAEARAIGGRMKKEVNAMYKLLEIDIDNIFKSMLLLNKKKYAALVVKGQDKDGTIKVQREHKGIDLVRRDWCPLSKDVGEFILDQVLSGQDRDKVVDDIHAHLRWLREEIDAERVPLQKFIITKSLTKAPSEYADAKSQPHVMAAQLLISAGMANQAKAGDFIQYIIVQGESKGVAERARPADFVLREHAKGEVKVDYEWYLSQQIHPPISRLVEHIDGTDSAQVASCLGLDPSRYHHGGGEFGGGMDGMFVATTKLSDEEKYKACEKLKVTCPACKTAQVFAGVFRLEKFNGRVTREVGLHCGFHKQETGVVEEGAPRQRCPGVFSVAAVWNKTVLGMREHLSKYYEGWLVCDDAGCRNRTRQMSLRAGGQQCLVPGCAGKVHPEYSSAQVYNQMLYYYSLFDVDHALQQIDDTESRQTARNQLMEEHLQILAELRRRMTGELGKSGHHFVDLGSLFKFAAALPSAAASISPVKRVQRPSQTEAMVTGY